MIRLAMRLRLVVALAATLALLGAAPLAALGQDEVGVGDVVQQETTADSPPPADDLSQPPSSDPPIETAPATEPDPPVAAEPVVEPEPVIEGEPPVEVPAPPVDEPVPPVDEPASPSELPVPPDGEPAPATGGDAPAGEGAAPVDSVDPGPATAGGDAEEADVTADEDEEAEADEETGADDKANEDDEADDEEMGRLQLVRGICPTLEEQYTEDLRVILPRTLRAQSDDLFGCQGDASGAFLVEGGDLPSEGEPKVTSADGSWRGTLLAGTYTVTDVLSGKSAEFPVVGNEITVVIAIEHRLQVAGTLGVRRYLCAADEDTTTIELSDSEPAPAEGCAPQDGSFQLNDGRSFDGGGDGAVTFQVPIGTYQFADLTIDEDTSTEIEIAEGGTTWVLVQRLATPGDVSVVYNFCDDPASAAGDPSDASYWTMHCDNPLGGEALGLVDVTGATVGVATTDGAGVATWTDVADGTYQIRGDGERATCAVFMDQQAALAGFEVSLGQLVEGQVFGCIRSVGNPGGENPGGNTGGGSPGGESPGGESPGGGSTGGGSTAGGDGTGGMPEAAPVGAAPPSVPYVTQLPSTGAVGVGSPSLGRELVLSLGLVFAAVLALGCAMVGRRPRNEIRG